MNDIYKDAFTTVKQGDPDYYGVDVDEMWQNWVKKRMCFGSSRLMISMLRDRGLLPKFWYQNIHWFYLGNRHHGSKLGVLQKNVEHNQGGSSKETERTRLQAPPVMYIPADEENYYIQQGNYLRLCCPFCTADLTGICVPQRQADVSYLNAKGDAMTVLI